MRRGGVYWISLDPVSAPERGKTRLGVIVSNSAQNERLGSIVVLPLSSREPEIWPLRLAVELPQRAPSYAVIPAIRQVSKSRLHEFIGHVPAAILNRLTEAVTLYLND